MHFCKFQGSLVAIQCKCKQAQLWVIIMPVSHLDNNSIMWKAAIRCNNNSSSQPIMKIQRLPSVIDQSAGMLPNYCWLLLHLTTFCQSSCSQLAPTLRSGSIVPDYLQKYFHCKMIAVPSCCHFNAVKSDQHK